MTFAIDGTRFTSLLLYLGAMPLVFRIIPYSAWDNSGASDQGLDTT